MKKSIIFLALIVATSGCKSLENNEATNLLDTTQDCSAPLGLELDEGKAIYNLTSACLFQNQTHFIKIKVLGETFQKILADGCADIESGYGHLIEMNFNGIKIPDVGIKVRGNSSRCNEKRQFKFKFDLKKAFSKFNGVTEEKLFELGDRRFYGVEGFSLRASLNDTSMIRERLSSELFHRASIGSGPVRGAPVYRTAFSKLFVSYDRKESEGPEGNFNRLFEGIYYDYKGIYTLTENIDRIFIESRYQNGSEKIKSSLVQADLGKGYFSDGGYEKLGFDFEFYKGKKLKEEQEVEAYRLIDDLSDFLRTDPTESEISRVLDVDAFINYTVAAHLTGHWDSILTNGNNDYLFYDLNTLKWQPVTWDLDNTFGIIDHEYQMRMSANIYTAAKLQKNQLFEKLFKPENQNIRQKLRSRFKEVFETNLSESALKKLIEKYAHQLNEATEDFETVDSRKFEELSNFYQTKKKEIEAQIP